MKLALALVLAACTSTRMLADLGDPRLHAAEHRDGFTVRTTQPWRERIDPNTIIRLRNTRGEWSEGVGARELAVDDEGLWIDRAVKPAQVADAVRVSAISPYVADALALTRPEVGASLEHDGDTYVARAPRDVLDRWLHDFEREVARLDRKTETAICETYCYRYNSQNYLTGDEAKLYALEVHHRAAPLGVWSLSANGEPWRSALRGDELVRFLHEGDELRVGWKWRDIAAASVENLSGGKTLGGLVVVSLAAVALAPIAALGASPNLPIGGGGGDRDAPPVTWAPELAPAGADHAGALFTTSASVRAIVRPVVSFDATAALRGDIYATGALARVRLFDIFEIGGGARIAETRGSVRSTLHVFQVGLHLPLDAAFRFAIPLGFEASGGGAIAHDLRVPWGLRYARGHWFATVSPATPDYLRLAGDAHGRWSIASGGELGLTW